MTTICVTVVSTIADLPMEVLYFAQPPMNMIITVIFFFLGMDDSRQCIDTDFNMKERVKVSLRSRTPVWFLNEPFGRM